MVERWGQVMAEDMPHFLLFYMLAAILIITLFHLATKKDVLKVSKVVLPVFLIINIVPLLANIFALLKPDTPLKATYLTRVDAPSITAYLSRFLLLGGEFESTGAWATQVQFAILLSLAFLYFYLHFSRPLKSVFFTFLTYLVMFLLISAPWWFDTLFTLLNSEFDYWNLKYIYTLLFTIFGAGLAYRAEKEKIKPILCDIRPFKLSHYYLMIGFGIALASYYGGIVLTQVKVFSIILILLSITFAWLFSRGMKNIEGFDKSKKDVPLFSSELSKKEYKMISIFFGIISLLYGMIVGFPATYVALLFMGNHFLYVSRPLNLRKVPFFSKIFISVNSLALVMLGYWLVNEQLVHKNFPLILPLFILGMTACANFLDLKSHKIIESKDRKQKSVTLPSIFGGKISKLIIGICFLITYLALYFVIDHILVLIPALIFGFTEFFLITRKDYSERAVLLFYLISLCYFIWVLFS